MSSPHTYINIFEINNTSLPPVCICLTVYPRAQVAGALCMWIKELSNYCKAHVESLEMEEKLDDLQDKLSVVTDEKVCVYMFK
jgi:hypothetical protein